MRNREYARYEWHDKSDTIVHLTKNDRPMKGFLEESPAELPLATTAENRLVNILNRDTIWASRLPHFEPSHPTHDPHPFPKAVCFSEAMPATIRQLVDRGRYSGYGILVHKYQVFHRGGGAVWYINNELFKGMTYDSRTTHPDLPFPHDLRFLLMPLAPEWYPNVRLHNDSKNEWTHEREWRVPDDFALPYEDDDTPDYKVIVPSEEARERIVDLHLNNIEIHDVWTLAELRKYPEQCMHFMLNVRCCFLQVLNSISTACDIRMRELKAHEDIDTDSSLISDISNFIQKLSQVIMSP